MGCFLELLSCRFRSVKLLTELSLTNAVSVSKTPIQAGSVPAGLISPVYLEYFQQTLVKKQMVKNSAHDELAGSSFRRFSE